MKDVTQGKRAVVMCKDLMDRERIASLLKIAGFKVEKAKSVEEIAEAELVVIDLEGFKDELVEVVRTLSEKGARLLCYGPHKDAEALKTARELGATVVSRDALFNSFPEVLRRVLTVG